MTDWTALAPGTTEEVDDDGTTVRVHHPKEGVFIIRRFFDGAWQNAVWIFPVSDVWSVSRKSDSLGIRADDLPSAIDKGVVLSREATR